MIVRRGTLREPSRYAGVRRICVGFVAFIAACSQHSGLVTIGAQPPYDRPVIEAHMRALHAAQCGHVPLWIYDDGEWEIYYNDEHFVPQHFDGIDDKERVKLNEPSNGRFIPIAEVAENGAIVWWWNACNHFQLKGGECEASLRTISQHECLHRAQWERIVCNVAVRTEAERADCVAAIRTPGADVTMLFDRPGVLARFWKTWGNGAHYQCREVEVYVRQRRHKQINADYNPILQFHLEACEKSAFRDEFLKFIEDGQRMLRNDGPLEP